MHAQLFDTYSVEWGGVPNRDRPVMIELAGNLGLDTTTFEDCLNNEQVVTAVREEVANATWIGVRSTPHFFINGQSLIGAAPYDSFQRAIEQAKEAEE